MSPQLGHNLCIVCTERTVLAISLQQQQQQQGSWGYRLTVTTTRKQSHRRSRKLIFLGRSAKKLSQIATDDAKTVKSCEFIVACNRQREKGQRQGCKAVPHSPATVFLSQFAFYWTAAMNFSLAPSSSPPLFPLFILLCFALFPHCVCVMSSASASSSSWFVPSSVRGRLPYKHITNG